MNKQPIIYRYLMIGADRRLMVAGRALLRHWEPCERSAHRPAERRHCHPPSAAETPLPRSLSPSVAPRQVGRRRRRRPRPGRKMRSPFSFHRALSQRQRMVGVSPAPTRRRRRRRHGLTQNWDSPAQQRPPRHRPQRITPMSVMVYGS